MLKALGAIRIFLIFSLMALVVVTMPLLSVFLSIFFCDFEKQHLTQEFSKIAYKLALLIAGISVDHLKIPSATSTHSAYSLVLSNHVSYLDIIVLGSLFPLSFVAKKEVASWPIIGNAASALGTQYVDRGDLNSKLKLLLGMRRGLLKKNICVFPEGTTTENITPKGSPWNIGSLWSAQQANSRIIAAGIHYENHVEVSWTLDTNLLPHLFRVLCKPTRRVYVTHIESQAFQSAQTIREAGDHLRAEVCSLCETSNIRNIQAQRFPALLTWRV